MPRKPHRPPSRKQIMDFIAASDQPAGKREIARAFGLRGNDEDRAQRLLKDMADEGLIDSAPGRAFNKMGGVPKVTVLRIVEADDGGHVWGVPEQWHAETPPPKMRADRAGGAARSASATACSPAPRSAARASSGMSMKKLASSRPSWCSAWSARRASASGCLRSRRRNGASFRSATCKDAEAGDLVLCEVSGRRPRITARVDAVLGDPFAPRSFSLIAIHKYGLRHEFSER